MYLSIFWQVVMNIVWLCRSLCPDSSLAFRCTDGNIGGIDQTLSFSIDALLPVPTGRSTGAGRSSRNSLMCACACACTYARGLSLHKRSRLHFVRGSRVEAARGSLGNQYESGGRSNRVTVSRHVIRVENTSNLEATEVELNGTMSNYLRLSLLDLTYFLHFPSPEYMDMYVNTIKRLSRKLFYMLIYLHGPACICTCKCDGILC